VTVGLKRNSRVNSEVYEGEETPACGLVGGVVATAQARQVLVHTVQGLVRLRG
jgi:hypothetical protein